MTSRSADSLATAARNNQRNPPGNSRIQQDEPKNRTSNTSNVTEEHIQEQNLEIDPPRNIENPVLMRAENNTRQRQKWTKEMNQNVVRCYYDTILTTPNAPYRRELHRKWPELYPETTHTEQRICDQKREIFKRAVGNSRGNWLTHIEIEKIRINSARNHEIIASQPREQPREQPNEQPGVDLGNGNVEDRELNNEIFNLDNEPILPMVDQTQETKNKLLSVYAESLVTPFSSRYEFKKPGKKVEKVLEKSLENVNKLLEDATLLTDITDVRRLNDFTYTCALFAIRSANLEKNVSYQKINENKRKCQQTFGRRYTANRDITDVRRLNDFTYACALFAIRSANLEKECLLPKDKRKQKKNNNWEFNLQRRINDLRADISKVTQMAAEQSSPKMRRNTNSMKGKYEIKNENDRTTVVETLKQRLLALNNRLSRYQLRQKQYRQNYEFVNKPNKLYDEIRNNKIQITTPPTEEQMSGFWKPIFQNTKNYNKDAVWLNEYKQSTSEIIKSDYSPITTEEIKTATSNFSNWKSPGLDKIQD